MTATIELRLDQFILEKAAAWGRRITWTEVAEGAGVDVSTLDRWRKNQVQRIELDALARVAQYLGCWDIGEILVFSPNGDALAEEITIDE